MWVKSVKSSTTMRVKSPFNGPCNGDFDVYVPSTNQTSLAERSNTSMVFQTTFWLPDRIPITIWSQSISIHIPLILIHMGVSKNGSPTALCLFMFVDIYLLENPEIFEITWMVWVPISEKTSTSSPIDIDSGYLPLTLVIPMSLPWRFP